MSHPDDEPRDEGLHDADDARDDFASLAGAWRHMATPEFASDADADAPVDAAERAAVRWLGEAFARVPVPAAEAHSEDDAASLAARAWMSAAWERLPAPAVRALPTETTPRAAHPWRLVLGTRAGRLAAAALLLVSFALALRMGLSTRAHDAPHDDGTPALVEGESQGRSNTSPDTPRAPDGDLAHDAHPAPAIPDDAGSPRFGAPPLVALSDRIESRSGRMRLVLLTGPPP